MNQNDQDIRANGVGRVPRLALPLLLTAGQDACRWIGRVLGRVSLAGVASVSVVAVLAIFFFIFVKSAHFLGSADGDNVPPGYVAPLDRLKIVADVLVEQCEKEDADAQARVVARLAWFDVHYCGWSHNALTRVREAFTSTTWDPEAPLNPETGEGPDFGMGAMIYGSLIVTLGAMSIAVPLGILAAVVLSDIAPFRVRQVLKPLVELLAAIPSVALGFFAIKVVAPWLQSEFGFSTGANALNASLLLAFMALPTIVTVTEDALTSLGRELRESSYSLGATRAETIFRVVIPAAHNGILAAVMLGMMRAVGETMVVWMAAGNARGFPVPWYDVQAVLETFFGGVLTMTAAVAADMGETPAVSIHRSSLFAVGLVLLTFTFLLNLITEYLAHRFRKGMGQIPPSIATPSPLMRAFKRWAAPAFVTCERITALARTAAHGVGYVLAFLPRVFLSVWGFVWSGIWNSAPRGARLAVRVGIDRGFTLLSLLSVVVIATALLIVIGPIFYNGVAAFVFQETIEHRLFVLREFGRGDADAIEAEYRACFEARRPVYDALDRLAWLEPTPLIHEAAKLDRETRAHVDRVRQAKRSELHEFETEIYREAGAAMLSPEKLEELLARQEEADRILAPLEEVEEASRQANRYFDEACEADDPERVAYFVAKVERANRDGILNDTPAARILDMARKYRASTRDVDITARERITRWDEHKTYADAFAEIRTHVTGGGVHACILGPARREGIGHLPMYNQYGASHWSRAKHFNEQLQDTVIYRPRFDAEGRSLENRRETIPRRDLLAGTPLEPLNEMLAYVDANLEPMLRPRWTVYGHYFLDPSTTGHFLGGIGPEILGTLAITLLSVLIAMPFGVCTAAYLVETANEGVVTRLLRMCINTLAGVPSIVFGLFGLAVIVGFVTGRECTLAGALTLGVLILPIIIRASEEAIRAAPRTYREASLGLGASPVRCFLTVTLPAALPGILTGTILAMSRAAGETAPLLFTCAVASGGYEPLRDMLMEKTPVLSYSALDIAVGDQIAPMVPHNQIGLIATLIAIVLLLNFTAILVRGRVSAKLRGS